MCSLLFAEVLESFNPNYVVMYTWGSKSNRKDEKEGGGGNREVRKLECSLHFSAILEASNPRYLMSGVVSNKKEGNWSRTEDYFFIVHKNHFVMNLCQFFKHTTRIKIPIRSLKIWKLRENERTTEEWQNVDVKVIATFNVVS